MWHPTLKWRRNLAGPSFHKLFYFSSDCESFFFLSVVHYFFSSFLLFKTNSRLQLKERTTNNRWLWCCFLFAIFLPSVWFLFVLHSIETFLTSKRENLSKGELVQSKSKRTKRNQDTSSSRLISRSSSIIIKVSSYSGSPQQAIAIFHSSHFTSSGSLELYFMFAG